MGKNITYIGEGIDRLVTLDVGARGVIYNLYKAAQEIVNAPLTLTAAQNIVNAMNHGNIAIIITGFIVLPRKV